MTDTELVSYLKLSMRQRHGISLPVDGNQERSVMAGLKRLYGPDAGNIIKWCLHRYNGVVDQGKMAGQVVTYTTFSRGMKWFTDRLYAELQQHRRHEAERQRLQRSAAGLSKLSDL